MWGVSSVDGLLVAVQAVELVKQIKRLTLPLGELGWWL
jgi:hypothetical protein